MNKQRHFVYLGCAGFPYGFAEVQKMTMISRGLVNEGHQVTIISNWSMHQQKDHPDLKPTGNVHGIHYCYTSGDPFLPKGFFQRKLLKLKGLINEFLLLKKMRKEGKLDYAIISTNDFPAVLYYSTLAKIIGFKSALNYVEYYSGFSKKWYQVGKRLNHSMMDSVAPKLTDVVFPISEFLVSQVKKIAPGKKYLKVPVLTDFSRYNGIGQAQGEPYFLYCGAAVYIEVIKFIIDAYSMLNTNVRLGLVVNGSDEQIGNIKEYIAGKGKTEAVWLLSKLSDAELNERYKNARALLIPLRPVHQDQARFPHKIAEYLASGNPVISTGYGEVAYYFKDMNTMLVANSYDASEFAAKMQFVIDKPSEAQRIGVNGRDMGLENFDFRAYGNRIASFLGQLSGGELSRKSVHTPAGILN